jgi:ATP-binding cassette subfamily G (WHITE) protein 2 (SNQ2)
LIDLPLVAFQHIIFILPFYFLTRLHFDAGHFFFFYLTVFLSTINFSNLLRLFAYYVGTLDDTFRYGGFSCTVLLLFAGFLVPAKDMRPYFGWLHWINPMYYAFENLFTSEFVGLIINCAGGNLVPSGNAYDPQYQTCTIPGSKPGATTVAGSDYVQAYGFSYAHRWRNIGILVGTALTYLVVGAFGSEIMNFGSQGGNPIVFTKSRKRSSGEAPIDVEKSASFSSSSNLSLPSEKAIAPGSKALTWQNLRVNIGEKGILKDISGYVRRGQLTALCGASGAGKTTLLSALSQTNFYGELHGQVLFENQIPGVNFKKTTGFAQQNDLHDGTTTVREALEFSALLRQPNSFSEPEKLAHVDTILGALDLHAYANALIGDEGSGLGVEILKRVTIGVELAARPEILFCDEPTSGLDGQGAANIIGYLRKLAHNGNAILVTVHQPSALLFSRFDNLLALSSEGEQLYFGRVDSALLYFERNGAVCPSGTNPASFILETVGAGIHARESEKAANWAQKWQNSTEASALKKDLESSKAGDGIVHPDGSKNSEFNASVITQSRLLTVRMLKSQWRNTPYVYSKIWVHVISAFLVGFTFYQVGTSPQDLQNRYVIYATDIPLQL